MKSCLFFTVILVLLLQSINPVTAHKPSANYHTSLNLNSDIKDSLYGARSNPCYCACVTIVTQPASPPPVCVGGGVAQFSVVTEGIGPFTYQWRENTAIISDNGIYSGTTSSTLIITNPPLDLNGKTYRCEITNCSGRCNVISANGADLVVFAAPTDINRDGATNNNDFILLMQVFDSPCQGCLEDINHDSVVNINDFLQLLGQFNTSCL